MARETPRGTLTAATADELDTLIEIHTARPGDDGDGPAPWHVSAF